MTVADLLAKLAQVRRAGTGWTARCPAHDDRENSLSIGEGRDGRVLVKCFAGCDAAAIVAALGLKLRDLFPNDGQPQKRGRGGGDSPGKGVNRLTPPDLPLFDRGLGCQPGCQPGGQRPVTPPCPGLTLSALSAARKLPVPFLKGLGLREVRRHGVPVVAIPYLDEQGEEVAVRFRLSLDGPQRFAWRRGDRPTLYGLWRLGDLRRNGWVLLVEGESDCWTGWHYGFPVLGIPGKTVWRSEWREWFAGLDVYLWQEPDAVDLVGRVAADLPALRVLAAPEGIKDLSDAHLQGRNVPELIERRRAEAIPASAVLEAPVNARLAEWKQQAAPVLEASDPLPVIAAAIRALGYGGDLKPALITYLAITSRLLAMRTGTMPVHLLLTGLPSAGKSYTLQTVLKLFPREAYHVIEAGSPRVLIYDTADLHHRALIFSEADSLPADEENPAASAMRNLLQDHHLHYKVTLRDPETGDFTVREVVKPGPTVLITTAIRRLGPQFDSRVFSLEVSDDPGQVQAALQTQATLELAGVLEPDPALVAFQAYLQALAPWEVVVPFAKELAAVLSQSQPPPRLLRDFARLLALVKAVALLRHPHRSRDARGRWLADLADYATVAQVVEDLYETTFSGASEAVREVVQAVKVLAEVDPGSPVTVTRVATHLKISKAAASKRIQTALKGGWLVNTETRKGHPYRLAVGEDLPDRVGLPSPDRLTLFTPGFTPGLTPGPQEFQAVTEGCSPVHPLPGESHPPSLPGWEEEL